MKLGISIFPGWKEIKQEQLKLIKDAWDLGYSQIFMGIGPGTHWRTPASEAYIEAKDYLNLANKLGYYTFFDVNPLIFQELNVTPQTVYKFKEHGFSGIRVDYGFSTEQIIQMTSPINIELNPFEFEIKDLDMFLSKVNVEKVGVMHNYYPVFYTAISFEEALNKSKPFKERGLSVGAFVDNSKYRLRTTLEILRFKSPGYAGRYLFLASIADRIFIGDPIPDEADLLSLKNSFAGDIPIFNVLTERKIKEFSKPLKCDVMDFILLCRSDEEVECEREEVNSLEKGNVFLDCKSKRIVISLKDSYGIWSNSWKLGEVIEKYLLNFKPRKLYLRFIR